MDSSAPGLRVLHVINQLSGRAGAEVSLRELVTSTEGDGVRHGVVVLGTDANRLEPLEAAGVPAYVPGAPLRGTAARVRHVRRAIRSFAPDLVHTSLFDANTAGRVAARLARIPVVTSLVNTPYAPEALWDRTVAPAKMRVVRSVDRILSRHATTHFHAITQAVADDAAHRLGIDPRRITVIPRGRSRHHLGFPSTQRRRSARQALGLPDDVEVLLAVGRQEAQKGHTYLVDALPAVLERRPSARLLLAGRSGTRTAAIQRRVAELGLEEQVTSLGVRDDVPELLCAADAFVFPSLYEGLGGAVIEAMALEVPIVATRAPALREVLDDGRCGLLVPVADAGALARAVTSALEDRAATAARVQAARQRFEDVYRLERATGATLAMYRDVAGARRRAQPTVARG